MATKPVIGVLLGDAAGVGPELVAKCAAAGFYDEYCRPVVIGDLRVLERALDVIGAKDKVALQLTRRTGARDFRYLTRKIWIRHRFRLAQKRWKAEKHVWIC